MTKEEYFRLEPGEKDKFRKEFAEKNKHYVKRALCTVHRTGTDTVVSKKAALDAGGGTDNVKIQAGEKVYLKVGHLRGFRDAVIYREHTSRNSNGEHVTSTTPEPRFHIQIEQYFISDERTKGKDGVPKKLYEILPSQFEDDFFDMVDYVEKIENAEKKEKKESKKENKEEKQEEDVKAATA